MPLNLGYIEGTSENGSVVVRVYYDPAWLDADPTRDPAAAPLINGPRGYCLDVTNTSGKTQKITLSGVTATPLTGNVGAGNPVTSGNGRSRSAAQLALLGFTTRGSVGNFQIG